MSPSPLPSNVQVGCAGHKLTDVVHDQEDWLEVAAVSEGSSP